MASKCFRKPENYAATELIFLEPKAFASLPIKAPSAIKVRKKHFTNLQLF